MLATDWELVEPNTWRLTLREGVTFHDGTPFDAEAVKFTFDRIAEAGGGTLRLGEDSTEIVDDLTVEVTPTVENRRLVEQLVHPQNAIIAPGSGPGQEQIGTGPFRVSRYESQEQLVVERDDDYWGQTPTLERIEFRFFPDDNARRLALEAGEIDVMLSVRPAMADVVADRGFVLSVPPPGIYSAMTPTSTASRAPERLSLELVSGFPSPDPRGGVVEAVRGVSFEVAAGELTPPDALQQVRT